MRQALGYNAGMIATVPIQYTNVTDRRTDTSPQHIAPSMGVVHASSRRLLAGNVGQ